MGKRKTVTFNCHQDEFWMVFHALPKDKWLHVCYKSWKLRKDVEAMYKMVGQRDDESFDLMAKNGNILSLKFDRFKWIEFQKIRFTFRTPDWWLLTNFSSSSNKLQSLF